MSDTETIDALKIENDSLQSDVVALTRERDGLAEQVRRYERLMQNILWFSIESPAFQDEDADIDRHDCENGKRVEPYWAINSDDEWTEGLKFPTPLAALSAVEAREQTPNTKEPTDAQ